MTVADSPVIPETVTVPASVAVEAIAAIQALADFEGTLAGFEAGADGEMSTAAGEWAANVRGRLADAVFGEPPEGWNEGQFPAEVAITSRASEMCAELIETHIAYEAENSPMLYQAKRVREHGRMMREAGTVDVMFPAFVNGGDDA